MHDMEEAYRLDRKAYKDKKPGLHKLAMLEVGTCRSCWTTCVGWLLTAVWRPCPAVRYQRVRADLLKTDLHETILDFKLESGPGQRTSMLDIITHWLTPLDPKSLPTLIMRTTLYQCINQLPGPRQEAPL